MQFKLISSLEKCFLDEKIEDKVEYTKGSCLKNECFQFQVAFTKNGGVQASGDNSFAKVELVSPIAEHITLRRVEPVAVKRAAYTFRYDENYLRRESGLYPDLLIPLFEGNKIGHNEFLQSIWVEFDPKGEVDAGVYPITLKFTANETGDFFGEVTFTLEVIDALLPEQELIYTQWFYCDCLKTYYNTETFDERHWQIIENFMKTAVKRGINMILTPIFTPILDTALDTERPTTQLVEVYRDNGKYTFNFDKLGRWIELCNKVGVKYFEISHLFTQWGAKLTPKVMATVDGEYIKLFSPQTTSATGDEYVGFLNAFLPELVSYLKSKDNADKRCYFHISDEPKTDDLESYAAAKAVVKDLLKGYPFLDALSHYDFYEQGLVDLPVPSLEYMENFYGKVPELWGYYCCWQAIEVSNHFLAQPSARNRIIGPQIYKYDLKGFLHWGYNFYYSRQSYDFVNPYLTADSDCFGPAGDSHVVYPAQNGEAYESLRLDVFHDALQDVRAFKLCEQLYSKEFVMNIIEDGIGELTFKKYPWDAEYILNLRERINKAIKEKI